MGGMLGDFKDVDATHLGATAIRAALERAKVDGGDVGEVLMGCCLMAGLKQAPARQAAHYAGVPWSAGATTLTKMCGSAMKARKEETLRAYGEEIIPRFSGVAGQ